MKNRLYIGDNFEALKFHFADASVDMIYADPPFNSNREYNVLYPEAPGAETQIKMFEDIFKWDHARQADYEEILENNQSIGIILCHLKSLCQSTGENSLAAYLTFMAKRLIELQRVMKPTGNIFLHCDQTVLYHLKILMDAIFGRKNFRNHLIWGYHGGGTSPKAFGRKHDDILFYAGGPEATFNIPRTFYSKESAKLIESKGGKSIDGLPRDINRGKHASDHWSDLDLITEGWHPMGDYWSDIRSLQTWSRNRIGQGKKPEPLLSRIIRCGSKEGDVILDPFVGYGTTVVVAQACKRKWIGIDISEVAIQSTEEYLSGAFDSSIKDSYEIFGFPASIESARRLSDENKIKFQDWVCYRLGARFGKRGGNDLGVDGTKIFRDDNSNSLKLVIISVKSGNTGPHHVRELHGALAQTSSAAIGVLVILEPRTKAMIEAAAKAGFYKSAFGDYPKIQIITVEEMLNGIQIGMPPPASIENVTFPSIEKVNGVVQPEFLF